MPTGTDRPLLRDYSKHQGFVDFQVAASKGVLGAISRASISWGYQDPKFKFNYTSAHDVGMYRSSYHVIYPDQPIMRQIDNWYEQHPQIDGFPRVIDLELKRGQSPRVIGDAVWNMSEEV